MSCRFSRLRPSYALQRVFLGLVLLWGFLAGSTPLFAQPLESKLSETATDAQVRSVILSPSPQGVVADPSQNTDGLAQLMISAEAFQAEEASTPPRTPEEARRIAVYQKASASVVQVLSAVAGEPATGSGVVITASGYLMTARHVVGQNRVVLVHLPQAGWVNAVVLPSPPILKQVDLAVLKVNLKDVREALQPVSWAPPQSIQVGQDVFAIGHPYGFERTLSAGILSRIDPETGKLQTDARLLPGNSGGPLLNAAGQLVGINQSIYSPEKLPQPIAVQPSMPANIYPTGNKTSRRATEANSSNTFIQTSPLVNSIPVPQSSPELQQVVNAEVQRALYAGIGFAIPAAQCLQYARETFRNQMGH